MQEKDCDYLLIDRADDYLQRGTGYPSLAVPDQDAKFDKRFIRDLVQEYLTVEPVFRSAAKRREV